MAGVAMRVINKPELAKKLDELATVAARKAMQATMNDVRSRGPARVAKAVTKRYNIKQGEIKPQGGGTGSIAAGGSFVGVGGTSLADMTLIYRGRLLTPIHFNMGVSGATKQGIYRIKATILRGHRVRIGHHGPRYSEGGAYSRGSDSPYFLTAKRGGAQKTLPFQRPAGHEKPYKVFKTVSIPQMVSHKTVGPVVLDELQKLAIDRLTHNMQRFLG